MNNIERLGNNVFLQDFLDSISAPYCLLSRWSYYPNYPIRLYESRVGTKWIHQELYNAGAVNESPSHHPWSAHYINNE